MMRSIHKDHLHFLVCDVKEQKEEEKREPEGDGQEEIKRDKGETKERGERRGRGEEREGRGRGEGGSRRGKRGDGRWEMGEGRGERVRGQYTFQKKYLPKSTSKDCICAREKAMW